jgi:hypothetical protein
MTRRPLMVALATGLALAAGVAGAADRNIQKWVDKNGVVHYGDAPPPDAVKDGRVVLNDQGVVVRQIPAQMTPEEAAAAKQKQDEESRRRAQDSFLLITYTGVADIERLRDERLTLIDAQIELARSSQLNSEGRLETLRKRMASFRPYSTAPNARRLPDTLAGEVVQALGERRSVQRSVADLEKRRHDERAKYDADIARYRELTSRPSVR